jgi:endoplasmic reticulum Man9GlcNAc2 1,2-alpha-mannosidase
LRAFKSLLSVNGSIAGLTPVNLQHTSHGISAQPGIITLGGQGDSFYEYMLKQYIAGGLQDTVFLDAYTNAMAGMREWLLGTTAPTSAGGFMFVGTLPSIIIAELSEQRQQRGSAYGSDLLSSKVEHLQCFLPGTLALGHLHGVETGAAMHCTI